MSQPPTISCGNLSENVITASGRPVPAALWLPDGPPPQKITLIGHGGYGHQHEAGMLRIVELLLRDHHSAVLLIDGPVHGQRRADGGLDPEVVKRDWREYWHADPHIGEMVEDWQAALNWALAASGAAEVYYYYGLSMGTVYGLPLIAADSRIRAAVLGMWGTSNISGPRLLQDADAVGVPVVFYTCLQDAIASEEFILVGERRTHVPPEPDTVALLLHMLLRNRESFGP